MTNLSRADEIARLRSRIDEIANTRPGSLELSNEYAELHDRLVQLELEEATSQSKERAYPVSAINVAWDRRTQHIHVFVNPVFQRRASVVFSHARTVRDNITLVTHLSFSKVHALRTKRNSIDDTNGYLLGIIGMDRLGFYEVVDSQWAESCALGETTTARHLCIVFADVVIEVLACEFDAKTMESGLSDWIRQNNDGLL